MAQPGSTHLSHQIRMQPAELERLLVSGTFEPHTGLDPEAYRRYVESEIARWTPTVKALDLKID